MTNLASKIINKRNIKILIIIFILFFLIMLIRGPEDDWICVDGQWVRHGVPSAPQPTGVCGR